MPTRTWWSPPAVARRPLPWGSKWAEYMGALSSCQATSSGAAFILAVGSTEPGSNQMKGQGRSGKEVDVIGDSGASLGVWRES